jgi:hypothetical protein
MTDMVTFWQLQWAGFWLRWAPIGTPERTYYQRMHTRACRTLGIEP